MKNSLADARRYVRCFRQLESAGLVCALVLLGTATAPAQDCRDSRTAARAYLSKHFGFPGPHERAFALSDDGLREVMWEGLDRFFPNVRFFYVFRDFERKKFSLLAVVQDCSVSEIHSYDTLSSFLRKRTISVATSEFGDFARLLVKLGNPSGVYGDGYSDGAGTIQSPDEITYRLPDEQATLESEITITPPTVSAKGAGFVYHFFSWKSKTSMALLENTLEWDPDTGVKFNWRVLRHDVGSPRG